MPCNIGNNYYPSPQNVYTYVGIKQKQKVNKADQKNL